MRMAASGAQHIFPVSHIEHKVRKAPGSVKTIPSVPLTGQCANAGGCCCVYIDWFCYLPQSMGQLMGPSSPNGLDCTHDMRQAQRYLTLFQAIRGHCQTAVLGVYSTYSWCVTVHTCNFVGDLRQLITC